MRTFIATLGNHGFHVATDILRPVMHLIEQRMGLPNLAEGTLNLDIPEDYILIAEAVITSAEYQHDETIKLQRCFLNGYKALIMRPDTHETIPNYGHGKAHLEIMGPFHFRTALNLHDGDTVEVEVEGDGDWWLSGK